MTEMLIAAWWANFGSTHITARQVVMNALDGNTALNEALNSITAASDTSPIATLRQWLRQHEGIFFEAPDGTRVCFILRDEARWQLYPVKEAAVA